jgi:hypothetical protein
MTYIITILAVIIYAFIWSLIAVGKKEIPTIKGEQNENRIQDNLYSNI